MIATIIFSLATIAFLYYLLKRKTINFPPGPFPFPIVGNLGSLGNEPHMAFERMSQKYGPIAGFKFGPYNAVSIHGAELLKEAFMDRAFSGKNYSEAHGFILGKNGILSTYGKTWEEQRRFTMRHLRDFGFGKSSMQEIIMDEFNAITSWVKKQNGKSVSLRPMFSLVVTNVLWKIIAGVRFELNDAKLHQMLDGVNKSGTCVRSFRSIKTVLIFFFPSIAKIFPNWTGWNRLVASKMEREVEFSRIIREHKESLQADTQRDFVDAYLQEIYKTKDPYSSFYDKTGEDCLKSVMADLFFGGTDTMSSTLSWLQLYLLHNTRVQEKMQKELDRVVGRSRPANLADRKCLIYTEAVILETFRLSSVVPYINHATLEDINFHGYNIPKGTHIFANYYTTHLDQRVWGNDAGEFRPERFLNRDETVLLQHEALIPFSTGRRVCPAETFARDMIFLVAANLGQTFDVTIEAGHQKPPLSYAKGQITLPPIISTVSLKERK